MDREMFARLELCFENNPERHDGIISGAQDSYRYLCSRSGASLLVTTTSGRRRLRVRRMSDPSVSWKTTW